MFYYYYYLHIRGSLLFPVGLFSPPAKEDVAFATTSNRLSEGKRKSRAVPTWWLSKYRLLDGQDLITTPKYTQINTIDTRYAQAHEFLASRTVIRIHTKSTNSNSNSLYSYVAPIARRIAVFANGSLRLAKCARHRSTRFPGATIRQKRECVCAGVLFLALRPSAHTHIIIMMSCAIAALVYR